MKYNHILESIETIYESEVAKIVEDTKDGFWFVQCQDSTGFWIDAKYPKPNIGDKVKLYCHQYNVVHGVEINGKMLYYNEKWRE